MQKLDRLGWAAGISIAAYGVRIGIRVNDAGILPRLAGHFPYGWKSTASRVVDRLYSVDIPSSNPQSRVRRFGLLYGDLLRLARTTNSEQLLEAFEADLRLYVAENARHRVFVHAGVVGWQDRAVVIPGRSYSGKTTLVTELVRAGAAYYSDEYAVFDAQGRIHPFAQPLSLRQPGDFQQHKRSVESLAGIAGKRSLPVGLVVFCKYEKDAQWRMRRLSPGLGALQLLAHTVSARRAPREALNVFGKVVSKAPVLKGLRGEAPETAGRILEYLERCAP